MFVTAGADTTSSGRSFIFSKKLLVGTKKKRKQCALFSLPVSRRAICDNTTNYSCRAQETIGAYCFPY